jgi:hypothetical protein
MSPSFSTVYSFPKFVHYILSHVLILHRFLERDCRKVVHNYIIFSKLYMVIFVLFYIVQPSQSSLTIQVVHRYANRLKSQRIKFLLWPFTFPADALSSDIIKCYLKLSRGRLIAQAVSRRLPTAAARVWPQVTLCGIFGKQNGTSVSPANSHSTDCSICRPGLVQ